MSQRRHRPWFAFFALAGDLGCSSGPTLVGMVSDAFDGRLTAGLFAAIVFPIVLLLGLRCAEGSLKKEKKPYRIHRRCPHYA